MKRFSAILVLLMLFILPAEAMAISFSDVPYHSEYYKAISYLSDKSIITGYKNTDGSYSFKPENNITRAEAATLISRAAELALDADAKNIYTDVKESHWGYPYIMAATKAKIVNGISEGVYDPNGTLTHYQILTMLVRMLGQEEKAVAAGGWPFGYVESAYENKIINEEQYQALQNTENGKLPVNRGDIAQYVYNAVFIPNEYKLTVAGTEYYLGMKAEELGKVEEIVASTYGFLWYISGTESYADFFAAGVNSNGYVVALLAVGNGFKYNGLRAGDTVGSYFEYKDNVFIDEIDGKKAHGVMLIKDAYNKLNSVSIATLRGESRLNFHCTNAFRVMHRLKPLKWNENAAIAAQLHSQDMASNDFFSHTGSDGSYFRARMEAQVHEFIISSAENIAAGYPLGFLNYDGWINSTGHRRNILGSYEYVGIGGGYNQNSTYKCYFTQDFYNK